MFCEQCGAQIPEGAKFCENCGAPVAVEASPKPTPQPAPAPAPQPKPAPKPAPQPAPKPQPKPSSKRIVIGSILLVLIIAAALFVIFKL